MFACQGGGLGLRKGQDYYSGAPRCSAKGCRAHSLWRSESFDEVCLVPVPIWVSLLTGSNLITYPRGVQRGLYRLMKKKATPKTFSFFKFPFNETSSFIST